MARLYFLRQTKLFAELKNIRSNASCCQMIWFILKIICRSENFDMSFELNPQIKSALGKTVFENIRADWLEMFGKYSGDEGLILNCLEFLINKYSGEERFYHGLDHIVSLLNLAEKYSSKLSDYECVKLAIWFHDAVYDVKLYDNEIRSASLAVANLSEMNFPKDKIEKVEKMILATQKHSAENLDFDGRIFLDFDLSILGADSQIYEKYSANIRREYSFVPESLYRSRRRKILENFLLRENLYFTEDMRSRFEMKARRNIKEEIEELL